MKSFKFLSLALISVFLVLSCTNKSNTSISDDNSDDNIEQEENPTSFIDERDGIEYSVVKIGDQIWMAENLKYLPFVMSSDEMPYSDPGIFVFDYEGNDVEEASNTENYKVHGVLYNFYAAVDACPKGWHLPDTSEWNTLIEVIGGDEVAGINLALVEKWEFYDSIYENFNFNALPGGYLHNKGIFNKFGEEVTWWSSTVDEEFYSSAFAETIFNGSSNLFRYPNFTDLGFYVRCLKD
ncbi:MAG: hypothetical protein GX879_00910 [Bacteroidales bacterium]|nr:hypothetical protein [Bacteroidales bacterium]